MSHWPTVFVNREDNHFWITCCDWRHDPASNDPDDGIRWTEWQQALQTHMDQTVTTTAAPPAPTAGSTP